MECPFCQTSIRPPPLPAGTVCTCPKCQQRFPLPTEGKTAVPPEPTIPTPVPTPAPTKPAQPELIPVVCFRCGTRVYASLEQVGKLLKCPDCHSLNPVKIATGMGPTPSEKTRVSDEDKQYRMTEAEGRPAASLTGLVEPQDAHEEIAMRPPEEITKAPMRLPTHEELDREKVEEEDWSDETLQREIQPFVRGIVSFMFQPQAIARWVFLGLGAALVSFVAHRAWIDMNAGGIYFFFALGETVAAVLLGFLFAIPIAVCCLRIISDTANGLDRIENWPDVAFLDWMLESVFVLAAVLVAASPGLILCAVIGTAEYSLPYWSAPVALGIWLLLPVLLLSMLEENSIIAVYSPRIVSTLGKSRDSVFMFYIQTCLVMSAVFVMLWLQAATDPVMPSVAAFALVLLSFIYSRLLGRLMLVCEIKRFEGGNNDPKPPVNPPAATTSAPPVPDTPRPPAPPPKPTAPQPTTAPPRTATSSNDLFE